MSANYFFNNFVDQMEEEGDQLPTLKVTWKARKSDQTNGGYSEEILQRLLSQVSIGC